MVSKKEINETRAEAHEVLRLLNEVEKALRSAKNWGVFDILGGGFLSSMIKHGKIDRAESLLKKVQQGLTRLQKELGDINLSLESSIRLSGFDRFMDIVFDNIFSDWLTQSRINESLKEVQHITYEIDRVIETLDRIEQEYTL